MKHVNENPKATVCDRMAEIDQRVAAGPPCKCKKPAVSLSERKRRITAQDKSLCIDCRHPEFWQAHIDRLLLIYEPFSRVVRLGGRLGQGSALPWAGTMVGDKFYGDGHDDGDGSFMRDRHYYHEGVGARSHIFDTSDGGSLYDQHTFVADHLT